MEFINFIAHDLIKDKDDEDDVLSKRSVRSTTQQSTNTISITQ